MACTQTLSGLTRDCASSVGGIIEVLLANADDVTAITVTSDKVTAITMASPAKFHRYALRRGNGSMNSTFTVDTTTGNKFVTSEVMMQFNRMETQKRVEITALAQGDLVCIVKDANGKYWYLGKDEPVNASASDGQTGTARADANRYTITLQDESLEMPYEVDGSIVDALVG